jgi:MFS family permease
MSTSRPRFAAGLPPTFWWLSAGTLAMALATFVFPFLALFLRSRGYSVGQTGLVVALFGAGSIPAGPAAGWLADRVGRRPALVGALAAAAALTALLPWVSSPAAVALVTLLLGVAAHAYWPVANALVADILEPDRYAEAYGLLYWERNAGIAFSFVVGGALASRGYGLLFTVDAATTLIFAALAWWKVPETHERESTAGAAPSRGFAEALGDRSLRQLLLLNVAFVVALFQFMVALPVAMADRGLSPADYGRVMAVNGVLIVLLQPASGRFAERFDTARVLALAALLVGAGYGAYAFATNALGYAAATAVWSLGEILAVPGVTSLVAKLSPSDLRGRYQGLLGLSFGAGLALAPALGGLVLERMGSRGLWTAVALLSALVAVGHIVVGRARRRRERLVADVAASE